MGIKSFFSSLLNKTQEKSGGETANGLLGEDRIKTDAVSNTSGITEFYYSYNASIGANSYHYQVKKEEERIIFSYEGMEDRRYGELRTEVEPKVLEELEDLYLSQRLAEWDGYHASDPNMLDGDGFSLLIKFADGSRLNAGGENAFPVRYREFKDRMETILRPVRNMLKEEKRQEKIREGLHGTLDFILASFIQHGNSGRDEYHIMIYADGGSRENYSVRVKSPSGEFFKGEYNVHKNVPVEVLQLEKVQKLVEKYRLIEWYDFEKTAKDYQNREWYQIELGFGEDMSISSMGTEYPPHYKQFRKEFLRWLKEIADEIEKL